MKIKWGMMMTDGRGKLGGQVASKNRAGAYVRTKVTPSNPQTVAQSEVRSMFAILSKRWSAILTEEQRNAWNAAVATGEWSKTDIFGDAKNPSGFNLFVEMNTIQASVRQAGLYIPPKKSEFAMPSDYRVSFEADNITFESVLSFVLGGDLDPLTRVQIQATAPVSAGRNYLKNLYRDIASVTPQSGTNDVEIKQAYEEKFGTITEQVGKRIGVRFRQVLNGQVTPWINLTTIVVRQLP